MSEKNSYWLAAHLYYAEPWVDVLVKGLKPFARDVLEAGRALQFFFVRYWERGPHIRLRFQGERVELEEKVRPALIRYFEQYYLNHPSKRDDPEWLKTTPTENQWYPNNSIQFIPYEPEIKRYGGEKAIFVAEEQFQASSNAVLSIMEEMHDWSYDRALGAAIQMHLGFAFALGMSLEEALAFFRGVFKRWLPRAYYFFEPDISKDELKRRETETLTAFQENFEEHKEVLLPFFATVWQALQDGQEFEQQWLNAWVEDMKRVGEQLKTVQNAGYLSMPNGYYEPSENAVSKDTSDRWIIYDSYVHMTNNRLGILNRDEGYLGFLMEKSIAAL